MTQAAKRLTLRTVNTELEKLGIAERLVQGKGYLYFTEGNAHKWPSSSVYVCRLNHLTLADWIIAYRDLAKSGQ